MGLGHTIPCANATNRASQNVWMWRCILSLDCFCGVWAYDDDDGGGGGGGDPGMRRSLRALKGYEGGF